MEQGTTEALSISCQCMGEFVDNIKPRPPPLPRRPFWQWALPGLFRGGDGS